MLQDLKSDAKQKMQHAVDFVQSELATIRTGRANPVMIEGIRAEVYGSTMQIKEVANINTPEPRQFLIQVWDVSNTAAVSKALQNANLGLNPQIEGQMIRVNLPPLTEETRKNLIKVVNQKAEEGKVRVRSARQEVLKAAESQEKSGKISEDELESFKEDIQKIHDEVMKQIEEVKTAKDKDLMEV